MFIGDRYLEVSSVLLGLLVLLLMEVGEAEEKVDHDVIVPFEHLPALEDLYGGLHFVVGEIGEAELDERHTVFFAVTDTLKVALLSLVLPLE